MRPLRTLDFGGFADITLLSIELPSGIPLESAFGVLCGLGTFLFLTQSGICAEDVSVINADTHSVMQDLSRGARLC
jgi:hypothetical protein